MKLFIFSNPSNATAALNKSIMDVGEEYGFTGYYKRIESDLTLDNNILLDDTDYHEFETADAVVSFGTWGSRDYRRRWDPYGDRNPQGYKEMVNKLASTLAKGSKKPHLVSETATLSRIRMNYLPDMKKFKDVAPKFYRLGLNHWTYGKTQWVQPDFSSSIRLQQFVDNFKQMYDVELDFENHQWKNRKSTSGKVYVLPGLEQDPTSTMSVDKWTYDTVLRIKENTNRRIVVKPHPLSSLDFEDMFKNITKVKVLRGENLRDLYSTMYCAVVDNSTSVFELVDAGIPVFCSGESFASGLLNTNLDNIDNIHYCTSSEYLSWAHQMSYTEYHLDEWAGGEILPYVRHLVEIGRKHIGN